MPWETVLSNEIISYSAGEQAKDYAATGRKVVEHDGVFFNEVSPGYKVYWPIDVLHPHARAIKAIPATRGHKMVVADPAKANGFLNIMVARDVPDFDIGLLSKKRRSDVRRSLKRIEVRFMDEPEGLIAQGASDVDASFRERTGYGSVRSKPEFEEWLRSVMRHTGQRWYGAFVEGRLAGFSCMTVVNRNACIGLLEVHTDFLADGTSTALLYELCRRSRDSGQVDQIYFGLHSEKASLNRFKEGMLFKRRDLPCYVHLRVPMRWAVRLLKPRSYDRLIGFAPEHYESSAEAS